jgi:hypothetical protein
MSAVVDPMTGRRDLEDDGQSFRCTPDQIRRARKAMAKSGVRVVATVEETRQVFESLGLIA